MVGGWLLQEEANTLTAPWFSLTITPEDAPWLFQGDNFASSWASTAAELLAALIAIKVFGIGSKLERGTCSHVLRCTGGVDNKAVEPLTNKKLSTKLPVMIILIEYFHHCDLVGLRCHLDWRPRDVNVPADDLTNSRFDKFDESLRIPAEWSNLHFPMCDLLMKFSERFNKRKGLASPPFPAEGQKFQKSHWG